MHPSTPAGSRFAHSGTPMGPNTKRSRTAPAHGGVVGAVLVMWAARISDEPNRFTDGIGGSVSRAAATRAPIGT